jgi:hypothetical protein
VLASDFACVVDVDAEVAVVALVAVDALPLKAAVIVPALKFPEASRLTIADAVFALVAVVHVGAAAPADVRTCPEVPAVEYACAVPVP